ncbi:MAG: vWA domain-containing protein [Geminicoccaceae bacterium]
MIGCNQDTMLTFDASGSMASMGYNGLAVPRIFEARDALRATLPQVAPFRRLGLVVYGPGTRDACSNVDVRLEPMRDAANAILAEVDGIQPEGETPLTLAVETAAEALLHRDRPGIVVLVTDGRETCGGSPCALAERLVEDSFDLTVHVIGFKIRGETYDPTTFGVSGFEKDVYTAASCLAERTGGLYLSAENTEELIEALQQTLGCALLSDAEAVRFRRSS